MADPNDNLKELLSKLALTNNSSKSIADHKFWSTQPVPSLDEQVEQDGPITPNTPKAQLKQEPYTLPEGYEWCTIDVTDSEEMKGVYQLLCLNYVEDDDASFRFNYKPEFLAWGLMPPGYNSEWHIGVRVTASKKLVGFISAIPAQIRVREHKQHLVEINFLCVHKKLRQKRLAPVLIKEVTRRVNLTGIFQAVYTAGIFLPKPASVCTYYHRSINPRKLVDVGFSAIPRNSTMARMIKSYKLPDTPSIPGFREMRVNDCKAVSKLLNEYLKSTTKFSPIFSVAEAKHWFMPVSGVVYSYVVEVEGKVQQFISFYSLPSTIINHPQHSELNAFYLFYYVPKEGGVASDLIALVNDALVMANKVTRFSNYKHGADVFNCLNLMRNKEFLNECKFGRGDGNLHYYFYNYRCVDLLPEENGLVLL